MGGNVLMSCPWVPGHAFTILSGNRIEPKQRVEPVSVVAADSFVGAVCLVLLRLSSVEAYSKQRAEEEW